MNVLIYTHHYPSPPEIGLVQDTKVVHYFARMLMKKGHRVQVVHLSYWQVKEISRQHAPFLLPRTRDYTVEGVPVRLIQYQMLTPRRIYPEWFQAPWINRQLRQLKRELGWAADKVFVHFPPAFTGLGEIFNGCSATLGDFHNMDVTVLKERDKHGKMLAFVRKLHTWGYRNRRVQKYLSETCGGSPVPVYTGIDAELLGSRGEIEQKKRRQMKKLQLVYAGQLIPLKKVDDLICAVKKLDFPCELVIIGEGPERSRLEAIAAGQDNITFTGWLQREAVLAEMKKADAFVMVSSPETYGMVYLEAMAQGCIPVASKGEGFDGLIRNGENGYLVQPGDVDGLACVLGQIAHMPPDEKSEMIENAYALACGMTEEQTTEIFLQANRS